MAQTNFAALTPVQKLVWAKDTWESARDKMFIKRFVGDGDGAMVQRVTELTKTEKGEQCIFHLVADLVDDGVVGDSEREGNEEEMKSYNQIIEIDLLTHSVKNKGKMAEQKTVIKFRENGKSRLSYWLANRVDQLAILTLSGVSYSFRNNGAPRASSAFSQLAFAPYVSAPTPKRGLMWQGGALVPSSTGSITAGDTLTYKAMVKLHAYVQEHYMRPLQAGGKDYYVFLCRPSSFAQLKQDADFQRAVTSVATKDGQNSPWFTGGVVTIDGLVIHTHRLIYNTTGAASGSKWGAGGLVDGTRSLLCGAQALGMADLGSPEWVEKLFDYDSKKGINLDKMFGLLKPKFYSIYDESVEDFGVATLDHAAGA